MKPAFIPSLPEITKEGLIVLCGAIFAALVIGQSPPLRNWIKAQWAGAKPPGPGNSL